MSVITCLCCLCTAAAPSRSRICSLPPPLPAAICWPYAESAEGDDGDDDNEDREKQRVEGMEREGCEERR